MVVEKQNGGFFRSVQHPFLFIPFLSSLFFIPFPSNPMRKPYKCARPKVLQPRFLPSNYLIHQAKIRNNHAKNSPELVAFCFLFPFFVVFVHSQIPQNPKTPIVLFCPHLLSCPLCCEKRREMHAVLHAQSPTQMVVQGCLFKKRGIAS